MLCQNRPFFSYVCPFKYYYFVIGYKNKTCVSYYGQLASARHASWRHFLYQLAVAVAGAPCYFKQKKQLRCLPNSS